MNSIQRSRQQFGYYRPELDLLDDSGSENSEAEPVDKLQVAGKIQKLVPKAFLSGGAAVHLWGSTRELKDLDFRIKLNFTFKAGDEGGEAYIEELNKSFAPHFDDFEEFEVSDTATGYTIKGECDGVEVSFTRTPKVGYTPRVRLGKVMTLGVTDLIWDKAYSMVFRFVKGSEAEGKEFSDLWDLVFMLAQDDSDGKIFLTYLDQLERRRGEAFDSQVSVIWNRQKKKTPKPKLMEEFAAVILETDKTKFEKYCGEEFDEDTFNNLRAWVKKYE